MLSYLAGVVHSFEKSSRGIPRSIRGPSFYSTGLRLGHSGSPERHGGPTSHRALYPSMRGTSGILVEVVSPK